VLVEAGGGIRSGKAVGDGGGEAVCGLLGRQERIGRGARLDSVASQQSTMAAVVVGIGRTDGVALRRGASGGCSECEGESGGEAPAMLAWPALQRGQLVDGGRESARRAKETGYGGIEGVLQETREEQAAVCRVPDVMYLLQVIVRALATARPHADGENRRPSKTRGQSTRANRASRGEGGRSVSARPRRLMFDVCVRVS